MKTYTFTLYIAGNEAVKSREIIVCIKSVLTKRLKEDFALTIVDVIASPEIAYKEHVFVTPSWLRNRPVPKKKIIGNFSVEKNVSRGFDLFLR